MKGLVTIRLTGIPLSLYEAWVQVEAQYNLEVNQALLAGVSLTLLDANFEEAHARFWSQLALGLEMDLDDGTVWSIDDSLGMVFLMGAPSAANLEGLDEADLEDDISALLADDAEMAPPLFVH